MKDLINVLVEYGEVEPNENGVYCICILVVNFVVFRAIGRPYWNFVLSLRI